jgi:hypothetical protein
MDLDMARKLERREINQTIEVIDVINGGTFGELINITVEGLMVMTETEIPTQSIYQLSIKLPVDLHGSYTVELGADCLCAVKTKIFTVSGQASRSSMLQTRLLSKLKI